jgi:pimeloyl-ACP methyl ester carboxylesterase
LSDAQQATLVGAVLERPCAPTHARQLTTVASDWDDIDAVVEYIRALRGVERVSLIGWSLGGPRAGGYAAQHPNKVARLVLLAPAYSREAPAAPPAQPAEGPAFNVQSHADFIASSDERKVGQRVGDAYFLARRAQTEADPPVEPMGTGKGSRSIPALAGVEALNQDEELVCGGVHARGEFGDGVADLLGVARIGCACRVECRAGEALRRGT